MLIASAPTGNFLFADKSAQGFNSIDFFYDIGFDHFLIGVPAASTSEQFRSHFRTALSLLLSTSDTWRPLGHKG